jgi:hypothetical protein
MYYIYIDPMSQNQIIVKPEEEKTSFIPDNPENTDYQAYLEWVAAGNTPTEWSPPE